MTVLFFHKIPDVSDVLFYCQEFYCRALNEILFVLLLTITHAAAGQFQELIIIITLEARWPRRLPGWTSHSWRLFRPFPRASSSPLSLWWTWVRCCSMCTAADAAAAAAAAAAEPLGRPSEPATFAEAAAPLRGGRPLRKRIEKLLDYYYLLRCLTTLAPKLSQGYY